MNSELMFLVLRCPNDPIWTTGPIGPKHWTYIQFILISGFAPTLNIYPDLVNYWTILFILYPDMGVEAWFWKLYWLWKLHYFIENTPWKIHFFFLKIHLENWIIWLKAENYGQKSPFTGASADGIITCKCHNQTFILEIKCTYSVCNTNKLVDAIIEKNIFINSDFLLKENHRYYTQIQHQLYVYNMEKCVPITWTPKRMHTAEVMRNREFIDAML